MDGLLIGANSSTRSFRVTIVTDLLSQNAHLKDLAGQSCPKTTQIYDRRPRCVTRKIVERNSIWGVDVRQGRLQTYAAK